MVKRLKLFRLYLLSMLLQLPAMSLLASEGLDIPEALEKKVPLENLSGISLFFARTYNENLWLYALYCTVMMAVVGMLIALATDVVLKAIGMEVHKIEHKE
ncbi:MAG: hypothetical protein AB1772_07655 [Candidatus Zixiibacteriota bacterium]